MLRASELMYRMINYTKSYEQYLDQSLKTFVCFSILDFIAQMNCVIKYWLIKQTVSSVATLTYYFSRQQARKSEFFVHFGSLHLSQIKY